MILPQTDGDGALQMAERWRQAVEAATFRSPDGRGVGVTVSIGVATFDPAHASGEDLVAAADEALYRAKHHGRNRVELARELDGDTTGPVHR